MDLVVAVRKELKSAADKKTAETAQRFFKEKVKHYGVKSALVRKIASSAWKKVKLHSKNEIFAMCEELYRSDFGEESYIASDWLPRISSEFAREDLAVFKKWISAYVNSWAKCDTFCNHTLGDYLMRFPEEAVKVKSWTSSKNRWLKRAAAVSFIVPAKKGMFLPEAFEIADALLTDKDDLVQKGYGWLLKEESRNHEKEVFEYVLSHRREMPRTALRYAIELMPKSLKNAAMKKD